MWTCHQSSGTADGKGKRFYYILPCCGWEQRHIWYCLNLLLWNGLESVHYRGTFGIKINAWHNHRKELFEEVSKCATEMNKVVGLTSAIKLWDLWDWHPSSVPQLYCKAAAMCSQPCRLAYSLSLHHTPQIIVLQSSENGYKHQVVNMIGAKILDHCQFMSCLEIGSEHRDAPYHREVRCLSGGKVLSRCFELCDVSVSGK